jgi:serine protease Do
MRQWGMGQQGHSRRDQGAVVPQQQQGPSTPSTQQSQSTQQGYLGVGVATITPELQQQYGLSRSSGVLVASVAPNGPALQAGIRQGDVIVSLNGTQVTQREEVVNLIAGMKARDSVSVAIDRNGQNLTLQVTLAARPASISG